jgi:hypothetical protein
MRRRRKKSDVKRLLHEDPLHIAKMEEPALVEFQSHHRDRLHGGPPVQGARPMHTIQTWKSAMEFHLDQLPSLG